MGNSIFDNRLFLPIIVFSAVFVTVILIAIIFKCKKNTPRYFVKNALVTKTEKYYYDLFLSLYGNKYIILPQINLASVIDKEGAGYRSELFRNVDFGVFDYNYHPILLIEINDNTHFRKDRIERDKKVKDILKSANLPLVTFWTKDGADVYDVKKALSKYLG